MRRDVCTDIAQIVTVLVNEANRRTQVLTRGTTLLRISDDNRANTGHLIDLRRYRRAVNKIGEANVTRNLGDNRVRVRIPLCDNLPCSHLTAVCDVNNRTVRDLVALTLAKMLVDNANLG